MHLSARSLVSKTQCVVCRCALPLQEFPFWGFSLFGPPPPPPGARRRVGATAGPERCAARLLAAGVLTLLDAALACQQARLPLAAAGRGARDVQPDPSALEVAGFAVLRRLEDTGLPYPVRPAAGSDAAQAGQATAAGIRALGTCCSALTRLLKLVGRREHAQPAPQGAGSATAAAAAASAAAAAKTAHGSMFEPGLDSIFGSIEDPTWLKQLQTKCRPVQLDTAMDTLFDASAVLTFWAPRPGKLPGVLCWAGLRPLAIEGHGCNCGQLVHSVPPTERLRQRVGGDGCGASDQAPRADLSAWLISMLRPLCTVQAESTSCLGRLHCSRRGGQGEVSIRASSAHIGFLHWLLPSSAGTWSSRSCSSLHCSAAFVVPL